MKFNLFVYLKRLIYRLFITKYPTCSNKWCLYWLTFAETKMKYCPSCGSLITLKNRKK